MDSLKSKINGRCYFQIPTNGLACYAIPLDKLEILRTLYANATKFTKTRHW